jgi:flagellar protein FliO/FliZ
MFGLLGISCFASAADTAVAASNVAPGSLVRIVVSLVVVVGLMIFLALLFKKFGLNRMQSAFPVKVIGAISVGNNQRIMIIEVGEEWLVLGVTPHSISTLTSMLRQEDTNSIVSVDNPNLPAWMKGAFEKYSVKKS